MPFQLVVCSYINYMMYVLCQNTVIIRCWHHVVLMSVHRLFWTLNIEIYLNKPTDQRVMFILKHHKCLVFEYLCYGSRVNINILLFPCGDQLYTSKVGPHTERVNPLTAKLFNLILHPLGVVSRWRDPQLQVSENYSDLAIWRSTVFKYCWLMSHFIFNMFKRWYLMC